jgi:rhomboid domain-containing protein 1
MGSGLSSFRRPGGFAFDPMEGVIPLLGLQAAFGYCRPGSARPPVTAALLAANVLVFLRPRPLHRILPRINDVALNYRLFLRVRNLTYL